jgi:hypothetical protein
MIEMFKKRHGMAEKDRDVDGAAPDEAPAPAEPAQAPLGFPD